MLKKISAIKWWRFLRYQELAQDGGVEALIDLSKHKPNAKNRVDESIEKAVLDYTINQPANRQPHQHELRKPGIFEPQTTLNPLG